MIREVLGELLGVPGLDVVVSGTVADALTTPTDVLIDYTSPEVVKATVLEAVARGVHVVVGTSGLGDSDFADIERAALAGRVGVVAAGNFAITAVLLQRFACEAASVLSHWEIVEYGSAGKPDAPSGTTLELAHLLSQVGQPEAPFPVEETIGVKGTRGATVAGSRVHAIRLPGYVVSVEVIFGEDSERLSIRYDAGAGPEPYIPGTLMAARAVKNRVGLTRGLGSIMGRGRQ
jgi:4-hydroxy-tetrahydrodipicolinate reductase